MAFGTSNSKIWASSGVLYVPFFWNMLQYVLKFESVLFTFTIIYITFLFSLAHCLCLLISSFFPLSPHSFSELYLLSLSLHFFAFSLYSTSLPPSLTKPRPKYQATPHHTNPTYTLISSSTNTATQTRPTTSTTTHGLITMPHHAAEHVVPSTTSSEPPTIGLLSIGLQWWVLLLGLFDLGYEFVWFAVPISLVFFFFFLRWRWWMWVCAGGGCRCCCGSGGCAIVVVDDDNEDDRE